jgi:hypothetical protein
MRIQRIDEVLDAHPNPSTGRLVNDDAADVRAGRHLAEKNHDASV